MKRLFSILMVCLALTSPALGASDGVSVRLDGQTLEIPADLGTPYLSPEGRVMIPLRAVLTPLGCWLQWEPETGTLYTGRNQTFVTLTAGQTLMTVNGSQKPLDSAPVLRNGRVYLPIRPVLEAYGYTVSWENASKTLTAVRSQTDTAWDPMQGVPGRGMAPDRINGGSTGIFLRKQLGFQDFDRIEATVTLPTVSNLGPGECPYVYFGFDGAGDVGNAEGGFQYLHDPKHPHYGQWTVCLRQGARWAWGDSLWLEPGSTHRLAFQRTDLTAQGGTLVVELDGREVIRMTGAGPIPNAAVKQVVSMATTLPFDGVNCHSRSEGARVSDVKVHWTGGTWNAPFESLPLYSDLRNGILYGTALCTERYLHWDPAAATLSIREGE